MRASGKSTQEIEADLAAVSLSVCLEDVLFYLKDVHFWNEPNPNQNRFYSV